MMYSHVSVSLYFVNSAPIQSSAVSMNVNKVNYTANEMSVRQLYCSFPVLTVCGTRRTTISVFCPLESSAQRENVRPVLVRVILDNATIVLLLPTVKLGSLVVRTNLGPQSTLPEVEEVKEKMRLHRDKGICCESYHNHNIFL